MKKFLPLCISLFISFCLINPNLFAQRQPLADAGPDKSICDGQSVVIGGNPTGNAGSSYSWDNAASLSSSTVANPTATPTVTTTYTVTVTDMNGRSATDQVQVTVNFSPTADAGIDEEICLGQQVTLGGSPTGPVNTTFLWTDSATLDTGSIANPIATPTVTTTYSVAVTTRNGCSGIDSVTITVSDPTSSANVDSAVHCVSDSGGAISVNVTGGILPYTYNWSTSDTTQGIDGLSAGDYTVTVTDVIGCADTHHISLAIDTIDLSVSKLLRDTSIATSRDTLWANQDSATYQWLDCQFGRPIPGATGQMFITTPGIFAVEITYNGCVDTSNCIFLIVGLEDQNNPSNAFEFYPSPAKGSIQFQTNEIIEDRPLRILTSNGKLVFQKRITQFNQELDLHHLESGIYILQYGNTSKKLILQE